jgi:hypothetical protein
MGNNEGVARGYVITAFQAEEVKTIAVEESPHAIKRANIRKRGTVFNGLNR